MNRKLFLILAFFTGLIYLFCYGNYKGRLYPEVYAKQEVCLTGTVSDIRYREGQTVIYLSNISHSSIEMVSSDFILRNPKVICYMKSSCEEIKVGNIVNIKGYYVNFKTKTNPGGFDLRKYYFSKGFIFQMNHCEYELHSCKNNLLGNGRKWIRDKVSKAMYDSLSKEDAGILLAMLLGERYGLDPEIKSEYSETGIAHILAISGMHISVFAAILYFIIDYMPIPERTRFRLVCAGLIFYAFLTDFPVSVVRAGMIFILRKGAILCRRSDDLPTSLAIAAFLTALLWPNQLLGSSFAFSYLAVFGLFLLPRCFLSYGFSYHHPFLSRLFGGMILTFITLPLVMNSYYSIPIYSIPLNLLVLPFVPYLFACGLGIVIFYWTFQPLCTIFVFLVQCILNLFHVLNQFSMSLPHFRVITGHKEMWRVFLFYLFFILFAYLSFEVQKYFHRTTIKLEALFKIEDKECEEEWKVLHHKKKWYCVSSICIFLILLALILFPNQKTFRITFLDVGQGDGIIIEDGKHVIVIDGGSSSVSNIGEYVLLPELKYRGIREVDLWILTHPDTDHVSGFKELYDNREIMISKLALAGCMKEGFEELFQDMPGIEEIPVTYLSEDEMVWDSGMKLEVLSCGNDPGNIIETNIETKQKEGKKGNREKNNNNRNKGETIQTEEKSNQDEEYKDEEYKDEEREVDYNKDSLVLLLKKENYQILFMADAGVEAEEKIMAKQIGKVDIIKIGHHGSSKGCNTEKFFDSVMPENAIISCGLHNVYKHPHEEVLKRLEETGSNVYRTDENGAIEVRVKKGGVEISVYGGNKKNVHTYVIEKEAR